MLPDAIELHPLTLKSPTMVGIPGSKSITNRALILAALSTETTKIQGALWSEDTQVMIDCLKSLGFKISIEADPLEPSNRTLTIQGEGGNIPRCGNSSSPLELYVGNAGTAARFLMAMLCLGKGVYRLSGVNRMHERPQAELVQSLRELGYRIDTPNDRLPLVIHGQGPQPGNACNASVRESSQFASALLLCASVGQWQVQMPQDALKEAPYVGMTQHMAQQFEGRTEATYQVEPDSSSGSYFWAMDHLVHSVQAGQAHHIQVASWPSSEWQIDTRFPKVLPLPSTLSRERDLGDSILTAMVVAPWADQPVRFEDLGRLRVQECERVFAMKTELHKCGVKVEEEKDTLIIYPGPVHGAVIDTYEDHRIAMCFSVLGTVVPGIIIRHPGCVKKTFPNFYQKLASPPPYGLGMTLTLPGKNLSLSSDTLIA